MKNKLLVLFIVFALAVTGSLAAGGKSEEGGKAVSKAESTLTVGVLARLSQGLSSSASEYGNRVLYFQAPYDSLLRLSPEGNVEPWLATEWSYDSSRTVLTMKLRNDVKFTDGTPFNAEAAKGNLMRFKEGTSPDVSNFSNLESVEVVDEYTIAVHLSAPDPAMINYMTRNASLMQSPATFGSADEATNPVGTGPYILNQDETIVDSEYVFYKNPNYWAPEYIKYDKLVLKVIEDPTAMVNALKAGEINAGNLANNDVVAEVEAAGCDIHAMELDWVGLTLVDRDGSMGTPLDNVKVRQAFNYAFDREAILEGYGAGFGTATTQVFSKSSPGYDPKLDSYYNYDPAKAKRLLAEAGYPDGFTIDMPSVTLLGEAVFAIIADQLADIGVTVEYTDESADFFSAILAPKYPVYLMFLEQNSNAWQFIQFLISKEAPWNPAHYTDQVTSDLISRLQVASAEDSKALLKQLGEHVTKDAWFVPWYRKQGSFATDKATDVTIQVGASVPYLFNFEPAN